MKITFIGDVHGKWGPYRKLIKDKERSLQVGDFGVGFINPVTLKQYANPPYTQMAKGEHFFIRGNHDNPSVCARHPFWIRDGSIAFGRNDIFCIGGALSIDSHARTEGYDWWPDEELSYKELCAIMDSYEKAKPKVVVTHDCPESIIAKVCYSKGMYMSPLKSRTARCLDNLLDIHKPDVWVHGHWHMDYHTVIGGVEFIGLGELTALELDI